MLERSKDHARETGPALESHYRFILWMVTAATRFPRAHKFLLGDRIQGAAMDVLESLIEATYTRRRDAHLARANLGVEKLRIFSAWRGTCAASTPGATSTRRVTWTTPLTVRSASLAEI